MVKKISKTLSWIPYRVFCIVIIFLLAYNAYGEIHGLTPFTLSSGINFNTHKNIVTLKGSYKPAKTMYFIRYGFCVGYPLTGMLFTGIGMDGEKYGLWLDGQGGAIDSLFYGGINAEVNYRVYKNLRIYSGVDIGKNKNNWQLGCSLGFYTTF